MDLKFSSGESAINVLIYAECLLCNRGKKEVAKTKNNLGHVLGMR
jgi:hypothetical protein